jgi:hypothetical protein
MTTAMMFNNGSDKDTTVTPNNTEKYSPSQNPSSAPRAYIFFVFLGEVSSPFPLKFHFITAPQKFAQCKSTIFSQHIGYRRIGSSKILMESLLFPVSINV